VIEAYCDESDSQAQGKPLLILAGYAASQEKWRTFGDRWQQEILDRYEIPFFHAKDLRSGSAKLYRHLGFKKRRRLVEDAVSVIADTVEMGGAVYLRPSDWKAVTTPNDRSRWGSAYRIAVEYLLTGFSKILARKPELRVPISVFLEEGHANASDALKGMAAWKYNSESFERVSMLPDEGVEIIDVEPDVVLKSAGYGLVSKAVVKPVQAADLLAYAVGTSIKGSSNPLFDELVPRLTPETGRFWCQISPSDAEELANTFREAEAQAEHHKRDVWLAKKLLREHGAAVYELKDSLIVDRFPPKDRDSDPLHQKALAVQKKLKARRGPFFVP
jgi:hypothetical protein